jgi:sec-independent protein translocase protein TatC
VVIFIIAAVATPSPDIFSQFLLAFPLILLYILSIFIARRVESRKAAEELTGQE